MNRLRTRLRASIADGPLVLLDFLSGGLDSRVTFTRGSNATLVDSTGKITYAPANLQTYSEDFTNAIWSSATLTITANSTTSPDGTVNADTGTRTTTGVTENMRRATTTQAISTTYVLSVYVKANTAGARLYVRNLAVDNTATTGVVQFNPADGTISTTYGSTYVGKATMTATGDGWYRCSITGTTGATIANNLIDIGVTDGTSAVGGNAANSVFIWGAQLEPVTYQTTPGTYNATTTAAYYGPRFDYDPVTLAPKGLLIEEQRTNLLTYSAQYDDPAWSKFGSTITANTTVSPDGTTTADTQTATATSGVYVQLAVGTLTNGQNYTVTRYVKAGTKAFCTIGMFGLADAYFDLANLTTSFTGTGAVSASITDAGNGWRRVSATWTWGAGTIYRLFFAMASSLSSQSGITVGDTLFLWGAQLEAGAFATSYIPTVASQVTRSADVATMTGTNFSSWFNTTQGTFVTSADAIATGVNRVIVGGGALGYPNYVRSSQNGAIFDVSNLVATANTVTEAPFKLATTYESGALNACLNGAAVATGIYNGNFASLTSIALGSSGTSTLFLNGHIRSLAYYNTRLPNATLQTLTAPPLVTTLSLDFINGVYDA